MSAPTNWFPPPVTQLGGTNPNDMFQVVMNWAQLLAQYPNLQMPGLQMPGFPMPNLVFPSLPMNPQVLPFGLGSFPFPHHQMPFAAPNLAPQWINPAPAQDIFRPFSTVSTPASLSTPGPSPASSIRSAASSSHLPYNPRPHVRCRPRKHNMAPLGPREKSTDQVSDEKWQEIVDYCKKSPFYNSPLGDIGLETLINPAGTRKFPQTVERIVFRPHDFYFRYQTRILGKAPKMWKLLSDQEKTPYQVFSDMLKEEAGRQCKMNWIRAVSY